MKASRHTITGSLHRYVAVALAAAAVGAGFAFKASSDALSETTAASGITNVAYQSAIARAVDTKQEVTVIGTGGAIAGRATGPAEYEDYTEGVYDVAELVEALSPEIDVIADIETKQLFDGGSEGLSTRQLRTLTLETEKALKTSDSVVVTAATENIDEVSYWLDLTVQSPKPVLVTGSMRPWGWKSSPTAANRVIGGEGPASLFNAIRLAASNRTYCFGTVVFMNDKFNTARDTIQTSTTRVDAFTSRAYGTLGWVDGNRITATRAPKRVSDCGTEAWSTPFDVSTKRPSDLPSVGIVYSSQNNTGGMIDGLVDDGTTGIVTMGVGGGSIVGGQIAARSAAIAKGVWFVGASRTGYGTANAVPGEGHITAGDLWSTKARILLILARAFTDDIDQARAWFSEIGNPSASVPVASE